MTEITHDANDDSLGEEGRRIDGSRRHALIVHEETELDIARAFCDRIRSLGGDARAVGFGEAGAVPAAGVTHLVVVLPRVAPTDADATTRLARMVGRLGAVGRTARGLTGAGLTLVQFGGGRFGTGPRPADPEVCGSAAFARSLHLERPDLRVRVIDVDPTADPAWLAERSSPSWREPFRSRPSDTTPTVLALSPGRGSSR